MKKISIGIAVFLAIVVCIGTYLSAEEMSSSKEGYTLGAKVPNFTLTGIDGKEYSLSSYLGKNIIILDFWSAQCPVIANYEEYTKKLQSDYLGKGVVIIGLAPNKTETPSQLAEVANSRNVNYPILIDKNHVLADKFNATTTPEFFILDKNGVIQYHGGPDNRKKSNDPAYKDYAREALDSILAGKVVATKETKSFGCTIKR